MRLITLAENKKAVVDDDDFLWLSKLVWRLCWNAKLKKYYAARTRRREDGTIVAIMMDREILGVKDEEKVIHLNGSLLDNRKMNLLVEVKNGNTF